MKRVLLLVFAVSTLGCSRFATWDAVFVGYNVSDDNVVVIVNDGQETQISANRSVQFIVPILVPKPPIGSGMGPTYYTLEQVVQVTVAFRNLRTGKLTRPIVCQSGAKVVTSVWYEMRGGYENTWCTSSF